MDAETGAPEPGRSLTGKLDPYVRHIEHEHQLFDFLELNYVQQTEDRTSPVVRTLCGFQSHHTLRQTPEEITRGKAADCVPRATPRRRAIRIMPGTRECLAMSKTFSSSSMKLTEQRNVARIRPVDLLETLVVSRDGVDARAVRRVDNLRRLRIDYDFHPPAGSFLGCPTNKFACTIVQVMSESTRAWQSTGLFGSDAFLYDGGSSPDRSAPAAG